MRLVIIESPYAGTIENNLDYAKKCVKDCLKREEAPIASHLLFTQPGILDDGDKEQRKLGIAAGHAWIAECDALVVYADLGISPGMMEGIEVARRLSTPIEFRSLYGKDFSSLDRLGRLQA